MIGVLKKSEFVWFSRVIGSTFESCGFITPVYAHIEKVLKISVSEPAQKLMTPLTNPSQ
jgi:hypothetical protein